MIVRRMLLLLMALLLLGAAALAEAPQVGDVCPDFELTTLDGGTFRLSECRGKVVFVNIWATWCMPCVMEMPGIQKLAETYPDRLEVIGVSVDDSEESARLLVEKLGYTYTFAMDDPDHTVSLKIFPSFSIPNSIFIDPDGVVTSIKAGAASYFILENRFRDAWEHGGERAEP